MKSHFQKKGWLFLPVTVAGWIITFLYAVISLGTLVWIDSVYNSLFHSLVRFFPYFMGYTVLWYWVSANMGNKDK